jgi:hypothetical protein
MVGFYYHNYTFIASPTRGARPNYLDPSYEEEQVRASANYGDSMSDNQTQSGNIPSHAGNVHSHSGNIQTSNDLQTLHASVPEDEPLDLSSVQDNSQGSDGARWQGGEEEEGERELYDDEESFEGILVPLHVVKDVKKELRRIDNRYSRAWKPVPRGLYPKGVGQLNLDKRMMDYVQYRREHEHQKVRRTIMRVSVSPKITESGGVIETA